MPTRTERIRAILAQGSLPPLEENVGDTSLPPVGVPQPVRPPVSPRIPMQKLLPPQTLRPPLARLGYRDTSLSPQARRALRETERINKRLERRAMARGLNIPDEEHSSKWANFLELLDNLNRPQSAVFNVVRGIGQGLSPDELIRNVTQGFSFEERVTFGDLLQDAGMDQESKLRKVLGFAGDVVLDPINLVPGYILTGPFKIAAKGARRVKVVNSLLNAAEATTPFRLMRKAFISSTGNVLIDSMRKLSISLERFEETGLLRKVATLDKKYRSALGDLYRRVPYLAERPQILSSFANVRKSIRKSTGRSITPEEYKLLVSATDEFKGLINEITDLEKAHGVEVPTLSDRIHEAVLKLQKKEEGILARKQKRILIRARKRAIATGKKIGFEMADLPFKVQDDLIEYVGRRLPAEPETIARPSAGGFVSGETGKLKLDVKGMKKRATQFVLGKTDDLLDNLDRELDALAGKVKFVEMKLAPKVNFSDPVTGARIAAGEMHSFAEHVVKAVERLREGKYASLQGKIIGTGKPLTSKKVYEVSVHYATESGPRVIAKHTTRDAAIKEARQFLGGDAQGVWINGEKVSGRLDDWWKGEFGVPPTPKVEVALEDMITRPLSVRVVKQRLREAVQAYARGDVDEKLFQRWLGLWVGPGAVELKNLTPMIAKIKARRAVVEQLVNFQGSVKDAIDIFTDSVLKGVFDMDELSKIADPTVLKKSGMQSYFTELTKRVDNVAWAIKGGMSVPRTLAQGGASITRPDFTSLYELGDFVTNAVQSYVKGDFSIEDLTDLFGVKGTPGRETLRRGLERIAKSQTMFDRIRNLTKTRLMEAELNTMLKFGPRYAHLQDLLDRVPDYVPHILSPEAIDQITRRGTTARKLFSEQHASMLWRRFSEKKMRPLDFEEVQAILEKGNLASIGGQPLFKAESFVGRFRRMMKGDPQEMATLFNLDPKAILATRSMRAAHAVGGADFLNNARKTFGVSLKAAPKAKQTLGYVSSTQKSLRGYVFDPEIASKLDEVHQAAFGPNETTSQVIKAWDAMTNYWKVWTLGVFPAYHFRNIVGTMWNMHLGGMFEAHNFKESLQSMWKAGQMQRWAQQGNTQMLARMEWTLKTGDVIDGNDMLHILHRFGPVDDGFYVVESSGRFMGDPTANFGDLPFIRSVHGKPMLPTGEELQRFGRRAVGKEGVRESLIGPEGALTRTGVLMGRAVENQFKAAFFIHQLEHTRLGITEATQKTAKFLFDYRDITQTEHVIKKWIPFYTWTRKNLPLQLEALVKQPHKFARIPEFAQAVQTTGALGIMGAGLEDTDLPPEEDIPQWIRESSPIPVRRNPNGTLEFLLLQNWVPAADIEQFLTVDRASRTAFSMMHPLPKVLLENQFGKSMYFDADLSGQSEFLGMQLDRKTVNMLRTVRMLNELDAMDPFGTFRKTRDAATWSSKAMRFSTGLRPQIASPEKERLRRLTERRERLQMILGQAKARERKERQRKQGVPNDNREPATTSP